IGYSRSAFRMRSTTESSQARRWCFESLIAVATQSGFEWHLQKRANKITGANAGGPRPLAIRTRRAAPRRSVQTFGNLPMSDSRPRGVPKTQRAFSGGPPKPPKKTARDLEDQPLPPDDRVELAKQLLQRLRKGK